MKIPDGFLPEDPIEGKVYPAPEGTAFGASNIITLEQGDRLIGHTQTITRLPNSLKRYVLGRTAAEKQLTVGTELTVVFTKYKVVSAIFIENFGWEAFNYEKDEIPFRKLCKIVSFIPIPLPSSMLFIYETIDLEEVT